MPCCTCLSSDSVAIDCEHDLDSQARSRMFPHLSVPCPVRYSSNALAMQYGPYFDTPPGLLENAQPALYVHVPKSIGDAHANAVKKNCKQIVSPLDVYHTLMHAAGVGGDAAQMNGSSLFHVFPEGRSCAQAGATLFSFLHSSLADFPSFCLRTTSS